MRNKLALCVGINDYPGTGADLSGCVNDALDWQALLESQGYTVQVLLNSDATKWGMREALREMVAKTRFGDRFVFQYSGHGTWLPDRDGDEIDGRDEALVPYDYQSGLFLADDEMNDINSRLPAGAGMLVLSDSCHSGTMSRFVDTGQQHAPRFLSPSLFSDVTVNEAIEAEKTVSSTSRVTASLISGCADAEYSYDAWFSGRPNGAFSRAAIDAYVPGSSLKSWHSRIRTVLPDINYPQTPQLTASSRYRLYSRAI